MQIADFIGNRCGSNLKNRRLLPAALVAIGLSVSAHILQTLQPPFMDEKPVLGNVFHFVAHRTLVASHTKYPTLYSYMITPFVGAAGLYLRAIGAAVSPDDYYALLRATPISLLWPARLVTFLCWAGTLWLVYRMALKLWGFQGAILGSVLFAVSPGLLRYSGYALPDVPMMFFGALALATALQVLHARGARHLFTGGLWAGLATRLSTPVLPLSLLSC